MTLPYLKMVCLEALRLYPAAAFVNRECTSSASEGFSLQPHVDFIVPPGMPAYISILGLHRDERVRFKTKGDDYPNLLMSI